MTPFLAPGKVSKCEIKGNWVHVAVAAEAHVRATRGAAAVGERIIVRSGSFFYQDLRELNFSFRPILHDSGT